MPSGWEISGSPSL